jgi:hypothetical protein
MGIEPKGTTLQDVFPIMVHIWPSSKARQQSVIKPRSQFLEAHA